MKNLYLGVMGALLMVTLVVGCVAYVPAPGPSAYAAYAPGPPPEALVEVRPAIPYPEAVWLGGYWGYHGNNWRWNNGYWDRRPHPRAAWEPGRWHHEGARGWGWRPGYWR